MFGASALLLIVICLGNAWWKVDASNSQNQTWSSNSPNALATLRPDGRLLLRVQGQGDLWTTYIKPENFIPDHGHLMHLFLIRLPYMDRMYHLHPERIEGGSFLENLPTVFAGKYQIFADIVDDNGVPWTAVGQIDCPTSRACRFPETILKHPKGLLRQPKTMPHRRSCLTAGA